MHEILLETDLSPHRLDGARAGGGTVRDDLIEHGYFFLDPCNVDQAEAIEAAEAIADEVAKAQKNRDGFTIALLGRRRRAIDAALRWPDLNAEFGANSVRSSDYSSSPPGRSWHVFCCSTVALLHRTPVIHPLNAT